jgi:hypothetical protein
MVVVIISTIFWAMMPCCLVEVYRHFIGTYCFLQGETKSREQTSKQQTTRVVLLKQ